MKGVEVYLKTRFGDVNKEWEASLVLMADNFELYEACRKSVNENGIYDSVTGRKNPLLSTMKDLQATILKQIQHFGLSPYSAAKIKQADEDDTEDFIDSLTN